MDDQDLELKNFLRSKSAQEGRRKEAEEPSDEDYHLFLSDRLVGDRLSRFLNYLRTHPEAQELVLQTRRNLAAALEADKEKVPALLLRKTRALLKNPRLFCPHCGKTITPYKRPVYFQQWLNVFWIGGAVISFALSFFAHRYFMQFLAVGILFGFKAVVDFRATKTQVLIYKALKDDHSSSRLRDLHDSHSHL